MDKNTIKNIKIKTGVLKRSIKDYTYYKEESHSLEEKVEKLRQDGAEEYKIQKQSELMQESANLIPTIKLN